MAGTAAHGSTPWLGDNAILKAHDVFRRIETLPFSRESSDLFDRPSINLARIEGGDAFNKVPDSCWIDVDIRFLPNQDPGEILAQIRAIGDVEIVKTFIRAPAHVSRRNPYVLALRDAVGRSIEGEALSVGRDGASDANSFLEAGVPARRVRPRRRRPPRPAGVGLDLVAGAPIARALGDFVHEPADAAGRTRCRRCARSPGGRRVSLRRKDPERPPRVGVRALQARHARHAGDHRSRRRRPARRRCC